MRRREAVVAKKQIGFSCFILQCWIFAFCFLISTGTAFVPMKNNKIVSPFRHNSRLVSVGEFSSSSSGSIDWFGGDGGFIGGDRNGRGGGGGGDGDGNDGSDYFGGDFNPEPHFILGSFSLALAENYKKELKQKAVSSSRLILSSVTASSSNSARGSMKQQTYNNLQQLHLAMNALRSEARSKTMKLMQTYILKLEKNPLLVKSLSSGLISACADLGAQTVEHKKTERMQGRKSSYDARRLMACFTEGVFIAGPIMHFGYDYFEKVLPINVVGGKSSNIAAITHVVADTIFLDSIFVATKMLATGILEGQANIRHQFQTEFFDTIKVGWVTSTGLFPIDFICFRFLPTNLRTLSMSLTSILWDGVITFKAHESRTDH